MRRHIPPFHDQGGALPSARSQDPRLAATWSSAPAPRSWEGREKMKCRYLWESYSTSCKAHRCPGGAFHRPHTPHPTPASPKHQALGGRGTTTACLRCHSASAPCPPSVCQGAGRGHSASGELPKPRPDGPRQEGPSRDLPCCLGRSEAQPGAPRDGWEPVPLLTPPAPQVPLQETRLCSVPVLPMPSRKNASAQNAHPTLAVLACSSLAPKNSPAVSSRKPSCTPGRVG